MKKQHFGWIVLITLITACNSPKELATTGSIEKKDAALDNIIATDAKIEILGKGYTWSEGPLWVESEKMLLFSDVPQDTVYKWTEKNGVEVYLTPSGYLGAHPESMRERGANGLTLNLSNQLVLCQQGERRIAVMDAPLDKPAANYKSLANNYKGKRFDSPNDVIFDKAGNIYFTDPPYGLKNQEKDSAKQIPFQGVYKVSTDGKVYLLVDSIPKPNGIALSVDQKFLYIASSDGPKPYTYRYELKDTSVLFGKVFFDFSGASTEAGAPDGMKVDSHGNIFATGPGGIWILNSDAKVLGRIHLPHPTANCALSADEKTLYMTSEHELLRVRLK